MKGTVARLAPFGAFVTLKKEDAQARGFAASSAWAVPRDFSPPTLLAQNAAWSHTKRGGRNEKRDSFTGVSGSMSGYLLG